MSRDQRIRHALAAASFAALLAYWAFSGFFGKEIVSEIAVFAILAMSLDLVAGYAGMVSLAHGALFGFGAYIFAYGAASWGLPPVLAILGASAAAGLVALLVGSVVSRVHGIFFIMATLAIGEMGYEFFFQSPIFGGDDGFAGIPRLDLGGLGIDSADPAGFALFLLVMAVAVYLLVSRLLGSPYGWALVGLHENEGRMRALGLPTGLYKTSIIAFSGVLAGFAGTLSAMHTQFITPQLLHWTTSGEVLIMVILGGLGTLVGPVIGAAIVILLKHQLSSYTDYWGFWMGLFLIFVVLSKSNGVVGWSSDLWIRLARRRGGGETGHAAR
jgi:branched-chain amino acid transport system permease protein